MKTINHYLADSISKSPDKTLFVEWSTGEEVTYALFNERLSRVAHLLRSEGVEEQDVVTLISDNSIDMAIMFYGVIVYGAIAKPLNPRLAPSETANVLRHSGSKIVFADRKIDLEGFDGRCLSMAAYRGCEALNIEQTLWKTFGEETGAELIYTSGTTGTPKGVLLSHRNIIHNVRAAIDRLKLDSAHVKLCLLPLFHNFSFISDLSTTLFCGGKIVIMDGFDISKLASIEAALREHRVNSFSAVPLMFELFVRFNCRINPPSMKFCVSGAAPLKEKVAVQFFEKYGFPIIPAYGLTESTCFCTISPLENIVNRAIGLPADNEIKIISEHNEELGPGEIGELIVKGESVMRGSHYRSNDNWFVDPERRWLKTGDLGYYDQNGYFYITGRKKNMVIRGGEKVYLEDVDVCLSDMPGIRDSATVGFQERGEEKIACFVVPETENAMSAFEVMTYIRDRMGDFKTPDVVIFQDQIVRTVTNKVKIRELQQLAESYAVPV
jgi:long-chain acyl-CoA synthetase